MKKLLKKTEGIFHYRDGIRIEGAHGLIHGDVSGTFGDVTDIRGDVTGIYGDLEACEITEEERGKRKGNKY